MPTFVFPTEEVLRLALTSGLVPTEVQVARARVQRTGEGGLLVTPEVPLARSQVKALGELGIRLDEQASGDGAAVSCWAELLPVRRMPGLDVPTGPVLFLAAHERELLPLAGELLRLGCDRQELCLAGRGSERRALLRAVAPPYFTLTRAIDRIAGLRAFAPVTAGLHGVWMELGHTHPLARGLQAPPGTLLLLPGEGNWMTAPDGPWLDLYQLVDLALPQPAEDWVPRPVPDASRCPCGSARPRAWSPPASGCCARTPWPRSSHSSTRCRRRCSRSCASPSRALPRHPTSSSAPGRGGRSLRNSDWPGRPTLPCPSCPPSTFPATRCWSRPCAGTGCAPCSRPTRTPSPGCTPRGRGPSAPSASRSAPSSRSTSGWSTSSIPGPWRWSPGFVAPRSTSRPSRPRTPGRVKSPRRR